MEKNIGKIVVPSLVPLDHFLMKLYEAKFGPSMHYQNNGVYLNSMSFFGEIFHLRNIPRKGADSIPALLVEVCILNGQEYIHLHKAYQ